MTELWQGSFPFWEIWGRWGEVCEERYLITHLSFLCIPPSVSLSPSNTYTRGGYQITRRKRWHSQIPFSRAAIWRGCSPSDGSSVHHRAAASRPPASWLEASVAPLKHKFNTTTVSLNGRVRIGWDPISYVVKPSPNIPSGYSFTVWFKENRTFSCSFGRFYMKQWCDFLVWSILSCTTCKKGAIKSIVD